MRCGQKRTAIPVGMEHAAGIEAPEGDRRFQRRRGESGVDLAVEGVTHDPARPCNDPVKKLLMLQGKR